MPSKPTTRWQVSGYRFLVRRMEHALVRRDVRMLHDPMRSQSRAYAAGLVLALVVLAGCGILAILRPQSKIGEHKILIGKESGAVYVMIDDVAYPTLNLASARLAAGSAAKPAIVKETELGKRPRGQLIGIPGAPGVLNIDKAGKGREWTVCDAMQIDGSNKITTSVLIDDLDLGEKAGPMPAGKALLVQGKSATYLVYDNKRARVDTTNNAVMDALRIRGSVPRPISEGLINSIPEVLPIAPPRIDDPGGTPIYPVGDHKVGEVVQESGSQQNYLVLRDTLEPISPFTADIVRNSNPGATRSPMITPYEKSSAKVAKTLPVQDYPETAPTLIPASDRRVTCMSWKPITAAPREGGGIRAELAVINGVDLPMPSNAKLVALAQADGDGPNLDSVYFKPGSGAFVQTTGIERDSQRRDSYFYVSDTGVRYGIKNDMAVKALGMDKESGVTAELAPWPIVGMLAGGPTLGREEAMVAHDGVAPDPSPAKQLVAEPK
ncbi:type VII secretion protein EccB [Nocardia sp. XZ_19_369]|uniref:type VII secretion protein EccB n=1 Tax=Nocardia sp. XZ_19_369 TaxID=2769487 RepID=UPI00188F14E1|nr:type VII secretion protein EccB [Nocardia sp. XZ_19_369]